MASTFLKHRTPLGLTLPIRNGGIGFFEQTFDTFTQTKTNIINLLKTRPGERRMQPLFGCRLYDAVFEQNSEVLSEYITHIVSEDIGRWISDVVVSKVDVKFLKNEEYNNPDIYRIYIAVNFTVTSINRTDSIELVIDTNKI